MNRESLTTAQMSPESLMYGHGFRPKKVWRDSLRFLLPSLLSKVLRLKSRWRNVDRVYEQIHDYILQENNDSEQLKREVAGLEETWPRMRKMLRDNRGMTKLMLDHGARSEIIYPYILGGSRAVALEVFNGRAFDLAGDFVDIPLRDKAILYSVWEPIGVDIRERVKFEQRQMSEMGAEMGAEEWEMLTCGAGLCSFLRLFDFEAPKNCHIEAVDLDAHNLDHLELVFDDVSDKTSCGCKLAKHNLNYEIADLRDIAGRLENQKRFRLVNAQGVASYYRFGGKTEELISCLLRMTHDSGKILLDLQVFEPTLLRCAACMGWVSDLFPDWTVKSAVRRMRKICRRLGLKMDYTVCSRNPRPTTVLFCLQRASD